MQRIYALEWYDIPKHNYFDLVAFHPYLTVGDDNKLFYINVQHKAEIALTFCLFSFAWSRFLHRIGPAYMRIKPYIRLPVASAIGGVLTYQLNSVVLKPIMLLDMDQMKLAERYLQLDLNADLMR